MNNFIHTFGADPEIFIIMNNEDRLTETPYGNLPKLVPPQSLIQDFDVKPEQIKDKVVLHKGNGYQWSEDGAAIELQMSPSNNMATFRSTLNRAISGLSNFLQQFNMSIYKNPLAVFDIEEYWTKRDESFRECVIFGCDPDMFPELYEDFGLDTNFDDEIDVANHEYRYGGGHLHIQAPENNPEIFIEHWPEAAIVFDFTLGLLNVNKKRKTTIEAQEMARLEFYGKPGRIRLQEYDAKNGILGIEYRVLSNYWISNPSFLNRLLMTMDFAAKILEKDMGEEFVEEFMDEIPTMYESILTRNINESQRLLNNVTQWLVENQIINIQALQILTGKK